MTNIEKALSQADKLIKCPDNCKTCEHRLLCDLIGEFKGDIVSKGILWWISEAKGDTDENK